jgi:hypothetical protein
MQEFLVLHLSFYFCCYSGYGGSVMSDPCTGDSGLRPDGFPDNHADEVE